MRPIYSFLAGAIVLMSSCSSTNTVRQTPDDVYYSPGSSRAAASSANSQDEYYSTAPSDRYVRMKTVDYARWSTFDDYNNYDSYYSPVGTSGYYGSAFSPYGYGYSGIGLGLGYFNPYFGWNSYFMWNTCYNPYFYNPYYGGGVILVNPKVSSPALYSHLGTFNPSSYHLASSNNGNGNGNRYYRPGTNGGNTRPTYYNNNPGSNTGSRYNNTNNYFRPANSGSNQSFSPSRSFAPSGGGGGGGGFRPSRH